jgi:hypothetical protein
VKRKREYLIPQNRLSGITITIGADEKTIPNPTNLCHCSVTIVLSVKEIPLPNSRKLNPVSITTISGAGYIIT